MGKTKFKVNDTFRLKEDHTFKQMFSIGEGGKEHRKAGSTARVSVVYDVIKGSAEASYQLDFGDFAVPSLKESKLLELFEAI
jgi:hypothetical protein